MAGKNCESCSFSYPNSNSSKLLWSASVDCVPPDTDWDPVHLWNQDREFSLSE